MIDTVGGVGDLLNDVKAVRSFCPLEVPPVTPTPGVDWHVVVTQNALEAFYGRAERDRHKQRLHGLAVAAEAGELRLQVLLRTTPLPRMLPGAFALCTPAEPDGVPLVMVGAGPVAVPYIDPHVLDLYEAAWTDLADVALDGRASLTWLVDALAWRL
jgi:hypothetical protein